MGLRKRLGLRRPPTLVQRVRVRVYPFIPSPRPFATTMAGRTLVAMIEQNRPGYEQLCGEIARDEPFFAQIARLDGAPADPCWSNSYLPPLDGMILYTLLRLRRPRTYLEIGSGNSTKFARKAIRDHALPTRIVSIDPAPRAEIDSLCDAVIRRPFQDVGEEALRWLGPGDMVFQDGSHHVFTNTDATVFYTEFLPVLPDGVTYGVHDIFLPHDYPEDWHKRWYNEQYLLASYLLAGAGGDAVVFPCAYVAGDAELRSGLDGVFHLPALAGSRPGGGAFWMLSRREGPRAVPS